MQISVSKGMLLVACLLLPLGSLAMEDLPLENADASFQASMDLESFLLSEVTVASLKAISLRESPGIITRVSSEEIAKSGARDLIDVLRLVPGFEFGNDLGGEAALIVRGIWSVEGKVNLLWNGQELSELFYGSLFFGNHYPVDQIDHIEIIRGPGSAIYGGASEFAVINVVTKGAAQLNGGQITGSYGQMAKTFGHRNLSAAYGKELNQDFSFSGSVFMGQGHRSDRPYTDFYGRAFTGEDYALDPLLINLGFKYAGLDVRYLNDRYHNEARDDVGIDDRNLVTIDYDTILFDARYAWQIFPNLTLTPRLNYKYTEPYRENPLLNSEDPWLYIHKNATRYTGSLQCSYDFDPSLNLIAGAEYYQEQGQEELNPDYPYFVPDYSEITKNNNRAGYAQALWKSPWIVVTAGARYENHNKYGSSFVPRLGLTKVINDLHFKLLASRAFRAPAMDAIVINESITPEYTTVYELETGYAFSTHIFTTVNFFDINVNNPMQYQCILDPDDPNNYIETYLNTDNIQNRGVEFECRLKDNWGYAAVNYSHYRNVINNVPVIGVPGHSEILLGSAQHKVGLNASFNLLAGLSLNPSATYLSERYAYTGFAEDGSLVLQKFDPVILANLFLYYEDAFLPNLNLGAGVYNFLDSNYSFLQAYDGNIAPLPGQSREYQVKVAYSF